MLFAFYLYHLTYAFHTSQSRFSDRRRPLGDAVQKRNTKPGEVGGKRGKSFHLRHPGLRFRFVVVDVTVTITTINEYREYRVCFQYLAFIEIWINIRQLKLPTYCYVILNSFI